MDLTAGKGIKGGQWASNEILRADDMNFIQQAQYQNLADQALLKAEGSIGGGNAVVLGGLRLVHDTSMTCTLGYGEVIASGGSYFASDAWGYVADPDNAFYTVVQSNIQRAFSNGDATHPRVDILEIRPVQEAYNPESRQFKDPITESVTSALFLTRMNYTYELQVVEGTAAASPVAASKTAGWVKLAEVYVPSTATSITQDNIFTYEKSSQWTTDVEVTIPLRDRDGIDYATSLSVDATDALAGDPLGTDITGAYKKAGINVSQPMFPGDQAKVAYFESIDVCPIGLGRYVVGWTERDPALEYEGKVRIFDIVDGAIRWLTDEYNWSGTSYTFDPLMIQIAPMEDDGVHFTIGILAYNSGGAVAYVNIGAYNDDFVDPTAGTITMGMSGLGEIVTGANGNGWEPFQIATVGKHVWYLRSSHGSFAEGGPWVTCGLWNGTNSIAWESWVLLAVDDAYEAMQWQMGIVALDYTDATYDTTAIIELQLNAEQSQLTPMSAQDTGIHRTVASCELGTGITLRKAGSSKMTDMLLGMAKMPNDEYLEARVLSDSIAVRVGRYDPTDTAVQWVTPTIQAPYSLGEMFFQYHGSSTPGPPRDHRGQIRYLGGGYFVLTVGRTEWKRTIFIGSYIDGVLDWVYQDMEPLAVKMGNFSVAGVDNTIVAVGTTHPTLRDKLVQNSYSIAMSMEFIPYSGVAGSDALAGGNVPLVFNNTVNMSGLTPQKDYYLNEVGTINGTVESTKITFTDTVNGNEEYFAFWTPAGQMYYVWHDNASSDPQLPDGIPIYLLTGGGKTAAARATELQPKINLITGITCTNPSSGVIVITCDDVGRVPSTQFHNCDYAVEIVTKGTDPIGLTQKVTQTKIGRAITSEILSVQSESLASQAMHRIQYLGTAKFIEGGVVGSNNEDKPASREVKIARTIISIGAWNMDTNISKVLQLPLNGYDHRTIISMNAIIYDDTGTYPMPLTSVYHTGTYGAVEPDGGIGPTNDGKIVLYRTDGGNFDKVGGADYTSPLVNRGYIFIESFSPVENSDMAQSELYHGVVFDT